MLQQIERHLFTTKKTRKEHFYDCVLTVLALVVLLSTLLSLLK